MHPVDIAGPRLQLRELTSDDVDAVHAIYGDAEATRHLSFEPRTHEQAGEIVARSIASSGEQPRTEYALGVVRQEERDLVGFARLALDPHAQKAATIGFALRPHTWGAGLGTETVHLMCDLGFNHLGLHRIWAARAPLNTASAKTLLRAGDDGGRPHPGARVRTRSLEGLDHVLGSGSGMAGVRRIRDGQRMTPATQ